MALTGVNAQNNLICLKKQLKTATVSTQTIKIVIKSVLLTKRVNRARLLKSCDFAGRLFHASLIRCEKKDRVTR